MSYISEVSNAFRVCFDFRRVPRIQIDEKRLPKVTVYFVVSTFFMIRFNWVELVNMVYLGAKRCFELVRSTFLQNEITIRQWYMSAVIFSSLTFVTEFRSGWRKTDQLGRFGVNLRRLSRYFIFSIVVRLIVRRVNHFFRLVTIVEADVFQLGKLTSVGSCCRSLRRNIWALFG